MDNDLILVTTDSVNQAECEALCTANGLRARYAASIEQITGDSDIPIAYDLGQMFPSERTEVIEDLTRRVPTRPTAVYTKENGLDVAILRRMERNGVTVCTRLDGSLLAIVPGFRAPKKAA